MQEPTDASHRASGTESRNARIVADATVHPSAQVGAGVRVWSLAQVREGATLGEDSIIGRDVYVDHGVTVGARCKIQNGAQLFAPCVIGEGVFIGPGAMLTNDVYPRAITPDGELKSINDWEPEGVTVERGASVGAGAIVIGGVTVGAWSVVAAGAVVTRNVPSFALVAGIPARQMGWVGRAGRPLVADGDTWTDGADRYQLIDETMERIS
jgi:acetyltransferase-like isoleucine patch superfamily enzyme